MIRLAPVQFGYWGTASLSDLHRYIYTRPVTLTAKQQSILELIVFQSNKTYFYNMLRSQALQAKATLSVLLMNIPLASHTSDNGHSLLELASNKRVDGTLLVSGTVTKHISFTSQHFSYGFCFLITSLSKAATQSVAEFCYGLEAS